MLTPTLTADLKALPTNALLIANDQALELMLTDLAGEPVLDADVRLRVGTTDQGSTMTAPANLVEVLA